MIHPQYGNKAVVHSGINIAQIEIQIESAGPQFSWMAMTLHRENWQFCSLENPIQGRDADRFHWPGNLSAVIWHARTAPSQCCLAAN